MENDQLIAVEQFCEYYNVDILFLDSLTESGLIETVIYEEVRFIRLPQLQKIERLVRLHDDLNLNLEGIEVVDSLLERIDQMHAEIVLLKNKLRFYNE